MADQQNPLSPEERDERARVQRIEREQLAWKNISRLRKEINKSAKEEEIFAKAIAKLQGEQAREATKYQAKLNTIKTLERNLAEAKRRGNESVAKQAKKMLDEQQAKLKDLAKTEGGALVARRVQSQATLKALKAEKDLIQDINKQRGFGAKILDLFRTKEKTQAQIDIARARAGGGVNTPGTAGRGDVTGRGGAAAAAFITFGEGIKNTLAALGVSIKNFLIDPFRQVSGLVSGGIGGGYGIGGGAITGGGATSILSGLQDIASKLPIIGGILGGLIGLFKGIADAVLGLDQGITNFARNLGISKDQAKGIKQQFVEVAKASDNIVVNEIRLMESQVELTRALGVRNQFSRDILENNVKLKEIAGLELETRKALAQTSVIQNRSATQLTKNILTQAKAFEFETGVAFEFRDVLNQASKQAGVLGLIFANNDKKLTSMYMRTKAMGYELKQLDSLASSFLDFETSISKEMEAQVLTGREMNLTSAREAALNNDLVGLAKEINKNVGSTKDFLNLNRIQQDAIAESVGMTRDGLAEVLKQQDYYRRLGATNLKQAQEQLKVMREQGLTEKEINKKIGEDAYNYITQTSTAERLTELMNRIKNTFIAFVEKSGILDFITNPDKIQGFITGLINRLAGAINLIGELVATIVEVMGKVVGFFDEERGAQIRNLGSRIRSGAGELAGGITAATGAVSGAGTPSIGATLQAGEKQGAARTATPVIPGVTAPVPLQITGNVYMDGQKIAPLVFSNIQQSHTVTKK